ncbi:MAG TPA: hypothetical protein VIK20_06775 [Bacteroidales bacterium]
MKKIKILFFLAALFLMSPSESSAQIHVNINLGSQPQWGPEEYDYVDYYYMPEIGIYYYAPKAQFIYREGNRWIFSTRLPYQYRNFNLYSTYKVVINEPRPYLRHSYYQTRYKKFSNYHSRQGNIRDSKDSRYRDARIQQNNSRSRSVQQAPNRNVQRQSVDRNHQNVQPRNDNRGNQNVGRPSNDRNSKGNSEKGKNNKGDKGNKGRK